MKLAEPTHIPVRKVVVVDDSPVDLRLAKAALENAGIEVLCASSGEAGMSLIQSEKPDLVILDYELPGINGLETLKLLRARANYVAVIFLSGNSDQSYVTECLEAGADDYLLKPYKLLELVARVRVRFRIKDLHDNLNRANAKLVDLSERDDLTGLLNMRRIYEQIEYELKKAKRYQRQVACVMMDMDKFKTINDEYDHLFGSFVLKQIGALIAANIRDVDLAARYGGDEFLVVLSEANEAGVEIFCERLRAVISAFEYDDGRYKVKRTISVGYAISESSANISAIELVRRADNALYQAKGAGRNCVKRYDPLGRKHSSAA